MNDTPSPKPGRINEAHDASPEQARQPPLCAKLLVYGTLKRGYWNHDRFCRNAVDIQPATTWGRLYALPAGYPVLEIPEEQILAHGTTDPLADAATQAHIAGESANMPSQPRPTGDWDQIHGELITFIDPACDLPPIDRLEGYSARRSSLYQRVLTSAFIDSECFPAWVYFMQRPPNGVRLRHGRWGEQTSPYV